MSAAEFTAYEVAALLARGASLITRADAALARLFYEPAPEAGDGQAALRPGAAYGPAPAHQPVSTDVLRPRDRRAHPAQMSACQDFTEVWTDHDLGA